MPHLLSLISPEACETSEINIPKAMASTNAYGEVISLVTGGKVLRSRQLPNPNGARTMKVHGKMLVRNFKTAFKEEFGVAVNVHNGFSTGSYADDGATLASIRSVQIDGASGDLELHGNMSVGTAEHAIKDALGFKVQILDQTGKNADNATRLGSLR